MRTPLTPRLRRIYFILLPLALGIIAVFVSYAVIKPKVQDWVRKEIQTFHHPSLPYQIELENVDWTLLFPSVELSGAELTPIKDFDGVTLPKVTFERMEAKLDLLNLMTGRVALSLVLIEGLEAEYNLDPLLEGPSEAKPLPVDALFDVLKKLPLSQVGLSDLSVKLYSEKKKWAVAIDPAQIYITNNKKSLGLEVKIQDASFTLPSGESLPLEIELDTILTKQNLEIKYFKGLALNSLITAKGILSPISEVTVAPQGVIDFDSSADLTKVTPALKEMKVPLDLLGSLTASGHLEFAGGDLKNSGFKAFGKSLQVDQIKIGDLDVVGSIGGKTIKIPKLKVTSESGLIDIKNITFEFVKGGVKTSADLQSDFVDIHQLLVDIGVGDIPLEAFMKADIQCQGDLSPQVQINCEGAAQAEEFEVRSGPAFKDVIVQLKDFAAKGSLSIDSEKIGFKTDLKLGTSVGKTEGSVGYKTGFNIKYSSPELKFADIKNLAHLKLEGAASVEGHTEGTSDGGIFEITYAGKDIRFENFFLGNPKGPFRYKKSHLYFDQIEGLVGHSNYSAQVEVDLDKALIKGKGSSANLDIPDLLNVFEKIFKMPVEMTGLAQAEVELSGPLALNKLSYELKSHISRGTVAGESFDSLDVALSATDGEVKIKNALVKKHNAQITAQGEGHPNGNIDLQIRGNKFMLEESENVLKLGLQVSGFFDFDMKMVGPVLTPETTFDGALSQFSIEDQDLPPSKAHLIFSKIGIEGTANLFEGKLLSEFILPYEKNSPFKLKASAKKWNYSPLFALVGAGPLISEYEANLSGDIDLSSPSGGIFASTGSFKINQFLLKRGPLSFSNQSPMELTAKNGVMTLKNFELSGPETKLRVDGTNFSSDHLDLNIAGSGQLRLLQIFVPFLEELAGSAQSSVHLGGNISRPEILGSAKMTDAFVKARGFPHPFEKITGEMQFSQHHISLPSIKGQIAGGTFSGDGTIEIEGVRDLPVNISAKIVGVNFNVPDKMKTNGNAEILISGNWFPFTLSGTYHVFGGYVDKEFTDSGSSGQFKQSSYLPKVILQNAFEPLLLDVQVILEKSLRIKNSMIDGSVIGQIHVRGTPTQPLLSGKIMTEKDTKVMARDKVFEVTTGNVTFTESSEINPELYVAARSRINEYDVNLLAQGTAKNPLLRFSSTPPLSEQDIISLLALGITSQQLDRKAGANEQTSSTVNDLGTSILANTPVAKEIQQNLGLNLQFSSQYDDTKNIAVQKITLSRNLTEKVKASASRLKGQQSSTEVKLEYSLNPNVSAIGTWENREPVEGTSSQQSQNQNQSILGLDLEFRREFK